MKYEVAKKQRGNQGEWFSYPAKRFTTAEAALEYAEDFANQQSGVSGTRIVVTKRKGSVVIKDIKVN